MKITAVASFRNEADLVRANVLHHLALGIDEFIIVDNGSTDSTPDLLADLAASGLPVRWRRQGGKFVQWDLLTELAAEAGSRGADWIVSIDADEFWVCPERDLRSILRDSPFGWVSVPVVNFVQRREQTEVTSDALLHMIMRPEPVGPLEKIVELVESEAISYVEAAYFPKSISRPAPGLKIGPGNHYVHNAAGPRGEAPGVVCLHAPLRARSVLYAKADLQRDENEVREYFEIAWHLGRWRRLGTLGFLEREWAANSYGPDGSLEVFGENHSLTEDHSLREVVGRWIEPPAPPAMSREEIIVSSHHGSSELRHPKRRVAAVMTVKNEADIIAANLLFHHSAGVDEFFVIDNGSTDGTDRILERLSRELPLHWTRDDGPFHQSQIVTELSREAARKGAGWIVPIDADEVWVPASGSIRSVLDLSTSAALECEVLNFVQRREQMTVDPECLLTMTMVPPDPVKPIEITRALVEAKEIAYVEAAYPTKWISRASETAVIAQGNHFVSGVGGPFAATDRITCLHAPLRARSVLDGQAAYGRHLEEIEPGPGAWHLRRWSRIAEAGELDAEWLANSYAGGALDVYGTRHGLVPNTRLRDAVRAAVPAAAEWLREAAKASRRRRAVARSVRGESADMATKAVESTVAIAETSAENQTMQEKRDTAGRAAAEAGGPVIPSIVNERSDRILRVLGECKRVLFADPAAEDVLETLIRKGCEVWLGAGGKSAGVPRSFRRVGSSEKTTRRRSDFDSVVIGESLQEAADPAALLRNVATVLRPGGSVLCVFRNAAHADARLALLDGRLPYRSQSGGAPQRLFTREAIERLFDEASLTIGLLERIERAPSPGEGRGEAFSEVLRSLESDRDALTSEFLVAGYPLAGAGFEVVHERIRELALRTESAESEVNRLLRSVADAEFEISRLTGEVNGHEQQAYELRKQLKTVQAELAVRAHEQRTLKDQIVALEYQLGERDRHISESEPHLQSALAQLQAALEQIRERDENLERLQQALASQNERVLQLEAAARDQERQRAAELTAIHEALLQERDALLHSQLQERDALHQNQLQEREALLQAQLQERDALLKEMQAEQKALHREIAVRDATIESLRAQLAVLHAEVAERQRALEETHRGASALEESFAAAKQALESLLATERADLANERSARRVEAEQIQKLTGEMNSLQSTLEGREASQQQFLVSVLAALGIPETGSTHAGADEVLEKLSVTLGMLREHVARAQQETENVNAALVAEASSRQRLERSVNFEKSQLDRTRTELEVLTEDHAWLKKEREKLETSLDQIRQEQRSAREEIQKLQAELESIHGSKLWRFGGLYWRLISKIR